MLEPHFAILKLSGKAPAMAECKVCHLKFFTPQNLFQDAIQAEAHLREKFAMHDCKRPYWELPSRFNRRREENVP
jgi:hypothetical protein